MRYQCLLISALMGRGSAVAMLRGMGRGSAGARMRGMGRGNDAKTALRVIKKTSKNDRKSWVGAV